MNKERIRIELRAVHQAGQKNLLDFYAVQRIAMDLNLHNLVLFIQEHRLKYLWFVLTQEL